ncbi:DNA alkylation repair protein [Chryseolinea lacunae]|uniref:DNA alkylation repair protein n=1 Tax=Chryseolinea lacunae TaxID=2801331 RepID=A0ABS1KQW8_9BACT|nr:DNA alkylation repair protein [Chryseolinea lacunae]MBL0741082.1 DNA alkylation repair protein [Chryseolinea lacunae]
MAMNPHHKEILDQIRQRSGTPTQHTFLNNYLGNEHPRFPINAPTLRALAREWMKAHRELSAKALVAVLTGLIEGESGTEKSMAGILLDYATPDQRQFPPKVFGSWLEHLVGWAEVDSLCTGKYTLTEVPAQWETWKPLLLKFAKSKNIQTRRASLVLLCSPLSRAVDGDLVTVALQNIDRLKGEKEILITKAISWLMRSMVKHHRKPLEKYLKDNIDSLPKIAVRETLMKLKTGKKTSGKKMSPKKSMGSAVKRKAK